jgi:long-subunit acyl-CoA synthetase (AMP-forming)
MLKNIITGTEPFPKTRLYEAIKFFGPIIYVGYGLVEVLPPIAILGPADYEKLESVGKVLKGVEIKFDENGKIALKSKTVSAGYADNPSLNEYHFKDGWFYTNDYGYLDKDGYLYVKGREEDIVSRIPRPVFAREIEEKIYEFVFIRHCAVLPNEGYAPHIVVSLTREMSEEEVKKLILDKISKSEGTLLWGQPTPQIMVKDKLPINTVGKLDKRKLREEFQL